MTLPDKNKTMPRPSGTPSTPSTDGIDPATGAALRSVYQETVEERVPDEMLDLLGKLN